MQVDYAPLFAAYDKAEEALRQRAAPRVYPGNALKAFLHRDVAKTSTGFQRMSLCR